MPVDWEVPTLEDYVTLPEAAEILGITKSGVHDQRKTFHSLRRAGNRPVYLVRMSEVEERKAKREDAKRVAVLRKKKAKRARKS